MQRIIVVLLCLFSTNLWADRYYREHRGYDNRFYIGGALASSELGDDGMADNQTLDNSTAGLNLFVGYEIDPTFAVELGIDWLGQYNTRSAVSNIDSDYSSLTTSVVGKVPLSPELSIYGQIGIGFASITQHVNYSNPPQWAYGDDSDTGFAGVWGVGFSFIPLQSKQLEFRLGFQQTVFDVNAYAVDNTASLTRYSYHQDIRQGYGGIAYHF